MPRIKLLCRKYLFPELFAALMLALSNSAASDDVMQEGGSGTRAVPRLESPWSGGSFDIPDSEGLSGSYCPWRPDELTGSRRRGNLQDRALQTCNDALETNASTLFSTGLRFIRVTDESDPSGSTELLCLVDGKGNILLSIVLASQSSTGTNIPCSFDGDLSAPVSYTTR